jgi:membrane protein implicated in regulation of membrane protease activity
MDAQWIVLAMLVVAVIGVLYGVLQRRRSRMERHDPASMTTDRVFVAERETSRLGTMSAEDQAWQSASLEKDRDNQQRKPPIP